MAAKKKKKKVSPIPKGFSTVTPALSQVDARATIAWCKKVFGAKPRGGLMLGPDKKVMHSELMIGDSIVMISDAVMDGPRASSLFLYVDNVDKTFAKAVKAGAKVMMPPADQFWGDRFGRVEDPFGNFWSIATHVEDVPMAEMTKRSKAAAKAMAAGG